MKEIGLPEPVFEYDHTFRTILNDKTGSVSEKVPEKVTEGFGEKFGENNPPY